MGGKSNKKRDGFLMTGHDRKTYDYPGQHEELQAAHKIKMKRDQLRKKRKKKKWCFVSN